MTGFRRVLFRSIAGLKLGDDGLTGEQAAEFVGIAETITQTERRAQQAERDAVDRYLAAFMAGMVGEQFAARISGVTKFGLFVTVRSNGANGLVPMSALPDEYWVCDEREQTLTGRRSHTVYRLAQDVTVRLTEARPTTGGLTFVIVDDRGAPRRRRGR